MDDPLEAARKWATGQHTRICSFGVCRSSPEGRYIVAECASVEEARQMAKHSEQDGLGHTAIVIALTPEGWVYELEKVEPI
jgi:hypothetical protein